MKFERFRLKEEELSLEQEAQILNEFEWLAISSQILKTLSSKPEFMENINKGTYDLVLVDNNSSRISGLIMKNIIDTVYKEKKLDSIQVLFFGDNYDFKDSNSKTLVISDNKERCFKDFDVLNFSSENQDSSGPYNPSKGKYLSIGVGPGAEKVSDSQQEINRSRKMIKFVSHRILELYQSYDKTEEEGRISRDLNLLIGEASDKGYIKTGFESVWRHFFLKSKLLEDLEKLGLVDLKEIKMASKIAEELHKDQKPRSDGAYIYHILRVAKRLVEEYGIFDPEIIISAILHDSVEDQASKLAEKSGDQSSKSDREKAFIFIKKKFGQRVEKIVRRLSNPENESEGVSSEEKNKIYREHVKNAITDPDAFLVKLSDFSDNVLNLSYSNDLRKRLQLSKKYKPLIEVFIKGLDSAQDILSQKKIGEIRESLKLALKETEVFIKEQEEER